MTVSETITKTGITPSAGYTGEEDNDDYILAIQTNEEQTDVGSWTVCADHIKGYAAALNPSTSDNTYVRTGIQTSKTGNQRSFTIEGNRVIGDAFQDYCLSHGVKYGRGSDIIVAYVYFSIRTGKGEKGMAAIIVNNDADGNAGEPAGVKIDLKAVAVPDEYTYSTTA